MTTINKKTLPYDDLCKKIKIINDCIHGSIDLTYFSIQIIDTPFFQRLGQLSQLGTCSWVYRDAKHTRFSHSVGTYHLAGMVLTSILTSLDQKLTDEYMSKIPELTKYYSKMYHNKIHPIDKYICELIKISALCHDIGHGPFSHVFDDYFLPSLGKQNDYCATHEERSGVILEMIIKESIKVSFSTLSLIYLNKAEKILDVKKRYPHTTIISKNLRIILQIQVK